MKLFLGLCLLFSSSLSFAAEKRCGWIANPTPANIWLTDADATWTISTQGGFQAQGMENLSFPDSDSDKYVRTNGYYGYFCGCVTAETKKQGDEPLILNISSSQIKTLKVCLEDPNLNSLL